MNLKTLFTLLAISSLLSLSPVRADLLINPAGGTVLQAGPDNDDISASRPLGFTGTFFGVSHTTVDVSTNGNLNFSLNTSAANLALPTSVARISPLWDDLVVSGGASGESVSELVDLGTSYTVTWRAHHSTGSDARFQVTWFGAATNIGGFDFLAGDVAFSYSAVFGNFTSGNATVGLDGGNSSMAAALPGDSDGLITNSQVSLLPKDPGQFILFRPDTSTSYAATIQTIPEPSASALWLSGLTGLLLRRRPRPTLDERRWNRG